MHGGRENVQILPLKNNTWKRLVQRDYTWKYRILQRDYIRQYGIVVEDYTWKYKIMLRFYYTWKYKYCEVLILYIRE